MDRILKLTIKIYSILSKMNIGYYPKFRIPIVHRQFFTKISQNIDYVQNFCKDFIVLFIFHVVTGV